MFVSLNYMYIVYLHCIWSIRLEVQVSALEKEIETKQQSLTKMEGQMTELQNKYEATPKQDVLERLKEDVKQLTEELQLTKNSVAE